MPAHSPLNRLLALRPDRLRLIALVGVFVLGTALRWLGTERALWLDEAWVVESVRGATLAHMFYYDEWAQTTPPGVLLILRCMNGFAAGAPELYRFVPLVFSVIGLGLMIRVYAHLLSFSFALCASLIVACSPEIIWYSTEIKQYATDLFASVVILWAGLAYIRAPTPRNLTLWFGAYGLLCVLSYTAFLFFPGIVLLPAMLCARGRAMVQETAGPPDASAEGVSWRMIAALTLCSAMFMAVIYLTFAAPNTAATPALYSAWSHGFHALLFRK